MRDVPRSQGLTSSICTSSASWGFRVDAAKHIDASELCAIVGEVEARTAIPPYWFLEDGADPHLIETRVTQTRKKRSAFEGYNRGLQWERTCAEVAKLKIARRPVGQREILGPRLDALAQRKSRWASAR
jgi:hypothetical protein